MRFKKIDYQSFYIVLFLFLSLISLCFWPFLGKVTGNLLSLKAIGLMSGLIVSAACWNILYYKGLKKVSLTEFEVITMIYPLLTIFLAGFLIPKDFNIYVFVSGIIASVSLVVSHMRGKHISFNGNQRMLIFTVFFMSIEAIFVKYLLDYMSPLALYSIRCVFVFIIFLIIYGVKNIFSQDKYLLFLQFLLALIGVTFMVSQYKAYAEIGVGFTILIVLLNPIIAFLWAHFQEKESLPIKKIIAAIIIIACIGFAYYMKG